MLTILECKFKLEFSVLDACNNDTLEKTYFYTFNDILYCGVSDLALIPLEYLQVCDLFYY